MAILTVSINDPGLQTKSAETAFVCRCLDLIKIEFGSKQGNRSSGSIIGTSATGVSGAALGSWSYAPSASLP